MTCRCPLISRSLCFYLSAPLLCLLFPHSVLAQADWSREVLATRDADKKEFLACVNSMRQGVNAQVVAGLVKREKHGPAVASVAGQYFEKGDLDRNAPAVLLALADRPDISAQAIAYAALSPSAPELIMGFSAANNTEAKRVAARMLAATAVMRSDQDREKMRLAENVKGKSPALNVNYREQVIDLLGSDDEVVLEYTLLAAGLDRVGKAKQAVANHLKHDDPAVAMAAQFACASLGVEIDQEKVLEQINTAAESDKPGRRRGREPEMPPALTYDPRGTARTYAIMAAGRAKLSDAINPLMGLLGDADWHTSVAAARALGEIGGEGMPTRLLDAMNDQTPWPVRVALYDAVGAQPDLASIQPLIARLHLETGRLRQDAVYALLSIAAGKPEGMTYNAFDFWWSANAETFKVDKAATKAWREAHKVGDVEVEPIVGFYDSAVISDRPVFAVDASLSMRGKQIESLQKILEEVVLSLPEQVKFNIVDFGGHVRTLAAGGMIPAENRKAAMRQFTYEMELTLGTRSYDAIERAILIPGMDTVHFLSDGAPAGSHLRGWGRMNYVTRLLCRTVPVAVHMIFFPEPGKEANAEKSQNAKQMKAYARAHSGKFVVSVAE